MEVDQLPSLVRQHEGRHHLAGARSAFSAAVFEEPRDQAIDRLTIGGEDLASRRGIGLQLFAQRAIHVAAALEGDLQPFGIYGRKRGHVLLRRIALDLIFVSRPPTRASLGFSTLTDGRNYRWDRAFRTSNRAAHCS